MKKKNTHKDLGFKVPEGYFESAMDRMFDNSLEQGNGKPPSFSVPEGYFTSLEDRILNHTTTKDLDSAGAVSEMPFAVPQDYFENLEKQVLLKTVDKPVVQMKRDYPAWVIPMLAVAAIFIAVVTINGLWQSNTLSMEDLKSDELAMYLADTDFTADQESMDILYSNPNALNVSTSNRSFDDEALLDYLVEEVDMNQLMEE